MLVEHRINHVDKGFVGIDEPVAAGQQVAFQHSLNRVFAQNFNYASVRCQLSAVRVLGKIFLNPELLAHLINVIQLIGGGFIRPENPEIRHIQLHDVAQERAQRAGIFCLHDPGLLEFQRVLAEVRQPERPLQAAASFAQQAAIGMRIGAHAACSRGRNLLELGAQLPSLIE